jgi:predicted signal transduction protein with EAL and GGDEF domain
MSSFGMYIVGFLILTAGLALAAFLLGAPPMWIGVGVIVLLGIGILSGVSRTRRRDPPEA